MRHRRTLFGLLLGGLLAGAFALGVGRWLAPGVPGWLDVGRIDRPAEWALVLGGAPMDRIPAAAALQRAGVVERVLLTSPRRTPDVLEGVAPPQEVLGPVLLERLGVPADRVRVLADEVDSTFDEARGIARFLNENPTTELIVVTDDYHTRRARAVFRSVLGDTVVSERVQFVGCPSSGFSAVDPWWTDMLAAETLGKELLKTVYYKIRY